ncbi:hypothetical protein DICPUDRAFT_49010 [Dictyostelium purpureum]|uniref:Ras guanine nucleotide exchange factor n=1 Tax=Dictyostelium purpureum TaxID=5786 RepID=F0ZRY3_DICPU|nr:uncharacterized protein DICPUDRAFT_49010 [Dictyostelium purpureum]EGC33276.1 hypothetical protein DICPUDRAFT_49010 [Dictyostelium purpureum]|eukprot:XP_003290177.1 hypothetical protein DICPUDRAFT_49010 [Dictyostelium purpureum]
MVNNQSVNNNSNNSNGNNNIASNGNGNTTNNNISTTPIYKSFQSIFETLLDELDYSKKRREELLSLTSEEKWIFLQRIKPDCTNSLINNGIYQYQNQISSNDLKTLISSPPKLNNSQQHITLQKSIPSLSVSSSPKSPRSHLKVLHLNSLLTFEDICKLKQQLLGKPVSWVINFAESTGIVSILSMISTYSNNKEMKTEDYLVINECLLCLKLLIELEMKSLLLSDLSEIFPLVLSPVLSTKRNAFEVLDSLCKTFYLGSSIVLESIHLYSRKSNQSLEKVFSFITTPLDGEFAADLKVNCMSLINHLISSKQSLMDRIEIRSKFLSNEILLILKNLRIDGEGIETSSWKQLDNEMKLFETMMVDDNNQISLIENETNNVSACSDNQIINQNGSVNGDKDTRSNSFNENSSFSSTSNINSISNSIEFNENGQELLKSSLNNEIVLNENKLIVIVSFHQKNKYKSRKQQIQHQQQQQQQLQFQKQLDDDDEDEENIKLDDSKSAHNEEEEDSEENVKSLIQSREIIVPVQRRSKASDIIRSLLSSNSNLKELGEWGLYVIDKNNVGSFLKDDEFIFEVDELPQQQNIVTPRNIKLIPRFREYRLKMIPWKVRISLEKVKEMGVIGNFTSDKCIAESPMDPTMTCSGLVYYLLKKHMPNIYSNYCLEPDDFGLYLDNSSTAWSGNTGSGYWLEPLEKLHDYDEIFKDPKLTVQLKLRPKGVKLKFADGTFEIFKLNLMLPTEKIFQEISEKVIDSNNNINLSYYGIFIDRQLDNNSGNGNGSNTSFSNFSNLNISSSFKETKKPEWLEKGLPLYHYKITDRCCLRFALRPSNISLSIDLSLFNKFKLKNNSKNNSNGNSNNNGNDDSDDSDEELEFPSVTTGKVGPAIDDENNLLKKFQDVLNFNLPEKTQIQFKEITVKLPLHLPLGEALEIDESWIETNILREKCSFHFDSFDGQPLNQNQPLNNQNFTEKNKIFVLLAEEEHNDQMDEFNKVNIWEEPFDSTTIICDPDNPGQIRAATLNKLLEQATNNIEKDRELMNILLMTYMSFSTSDILLDKLVERYNVPDHEKDQKSVVQLHTIVFLKNWLEQQAPQAASGGGLEEKFLVRLSDFVDKQITNDGYTKIVPQLKKWIDSALKEKRAYAMPEASRPNTYGKLSISSSISSRTLLDDELFVAQQLTIREYDTFKRIQAVEFLGQSWSKAKLQYKAKNLLKMIERFNKYSTGVSTAILSQPKLKSRVKLICRFIKIAQHCRELNNFHLLTAFMAGIRNSNVIRLRLTWAKVPKKYLHILEDLEKIMSMEGSFKEFRQKMAETIPPCIPYLGVYLKDLTFIEEGNPDTINSLINWSKKKLIFNIVSIIQRCQQVPYDFGSLSQLNQARSEMLLNYFDTLPTAIDELLYKISLNLEPRQSTTTTTN